MALTEREPAIRRKKRGKKTWKCGKCRVDIVKSKFTHSVRICDDCWALAEQAKRERLKRGRRVRGRTFYYEPRD